VYPRDRPYTTMYFNLSLCLYLCARADLGYDGIGPYQSIDSHYIYTPLTSCGDGVRIDMSSGAAHAATVKSVRDLQVPVLNKDFL